MFSYPPKVLAPWPASLTFPLLEIHLRNPACNNCTIASTSRIGENQKRQDCQGRFDPPRFVFIPCTIELSSRGGIHLISSSLTFAGMPQLRKVFLRSAVSSFTPPGNVGLLHAHGPCLRVQRICSNSSRSRTRPLTPIANLRLSDPLHSCCFLPPPRV